MSGAMVNLGIFGLLSFYNINTAVCGWVLGILGMIGTLSGIMFSLTKRNIKAILAYSTVENCGIITFGVGCGILGGAYHLPGLEAFGYLGAFMHLINHASLKGALFLGAGSVYHASGSLDADKLGGLIRKMPSTGKMFTMASLALSGLPPFNAFLSELVIYVALFSGLAGSGNLPVAIFCACGITILGAAGAFALASLIRASSGVFFGEPRDKEIFDNTENESPLMGRAMFITLVPSLIMTIAADKIAKLIFDACSVLYTFNADIQDAAIRRISYILQSACKFNILICCMTVLVCVICTYMRRRHRELAGPTWDCGYIKPTPRMQYTSSALVQSITDFFAPVFGIASRRRGVAITGEQGSDPADRIFWNLIFKVTAKWSEKIHRFQTGYLHFYILVMVCALFAMLVWAYFSGGKN
jgi:NADH:ubiquinone oxidoreductase subunit 5 (subunit L)/multisubunit Na+/H+ antiporter MnhA subunit